MYRTPENPSSVNRTSNFDLNRFYGGWKWLAISCYQNICTKVLFPPSKPLKRYPQINSPFRKIKMKPFNLTRSPKSVNLFVMNTNETSRSYTPRQLSELLGYQIDSVYAMISRREIQSSKVGRNRIISQNQVNDFLHRRKIHDQIIDYPK